MNTIRHVALLACLFSSAAWAQSADRALNLQLPPSDLPATASSSASQPARDSHGNPTSPPGVYYGDTSGRPGNGGGNVAGQRCDDATYNQPQVHGSASMGVMGGNHVSGSYQAATIDVTKNFGDCGHPSGGIGVSIHVGQGRFHGHRW